MKCLAVGRLGIAFLLTFALLVSAAWQKILADNATLIVAGAEGARPPVIGEAINDGDENLAARGRSYLQPTIFCPALLASASKRSASRTTASAKKNLKLYRLHGVLLI